MADIILNTLFYNSFSSYSNPLKLVLLSVGENWDYIFSVKILLIVLGIELRTFRILVKGSNTKVYP